MVSMNSNSNNREAAFDKATLIITTINAELLAIAATLTVVELL